MRRIGVLVLVAAIGWIGFRSRPKSSEGVEPQREILPLSAAIPFAPLALPPVVPAAPPSHLPDGITAYCAGVPESCVIETGPESHRYRLAGVRAPAILQATGGVEVAARESVEDLRRRAVHRDLRLVDAGGPGMVVAYVASDGVMLNEAIVADGFAFFDPTSGVDEATADRLRKAEERAKEAKAGLWGPTDELRLKMDRPIEVAEADGWLKIGDNLYVRNRPAAKEWYRKVVAVYPRSSAAAEARRHLLIPPIKLEIPYLSVDLVAETLSLLTKDSRIARPALPDPPADRYAPPPVVRVEDSTPSFAGSGSTYDSSPSSSYSGSSTWRSYTPRHTPGTEVHVKGYFRKNGTYVAPHTRSAPRRR